MPGLSAGCGTALLTVATNGKRTKFTAVQKLVMGFFDGDYIKTETWFNTANPMFGGVSPDMMIRLGRDEKLYDLVKQALDENKPKI